MICPDMRSWACPVIEISVTELENFPHERFSPVTEMTLERSLFISVNRAELLHMNSNRAKISARFPGWNFPYEQKTKFVPVAGLILRGPQLSLLYRSIFTEVVQSEYSDTSYRSSCSTDTEINFSYTDLILAWVLFTVKLSTNPLMPRNERKYCFRVLHVLLGF